jgi:hypothetical protein
MIEDTHIKAVIWQAWIDKDYPLIAKWVAECDTAVWNYDGPHTHYNGKTYYSVILFDSSEDLLVFKLKFPQVIL